MVKNTMAAPYGPAMKVAGSSRRMSYNGASALGGVSAEPPKENPWRKYRLKVFPRRINGVWYAPGSIVYRRFVLSPGGGFYEYGDDFDYLKWTS